MHAWTEKSDHEVSHHFKCRGGWGWGVCEIFDRHQKFFGELFFRVQLEPEIVRILSDLTDKNLKD